MKPGEGPTTEYAPALDDRAAGTLGPMGAAERPLPPDPGTDVTSDADRSRSTNRSLRDMVASLAHSRRRWQRPFWFGVIGLYNTGFSYAFFVTLHIVFPGLHYLVLLVITHVVSVLNAFVAYRFLFFKVRGRVVADLLRFWAVYLSSFAINLAVLPLLVEVCGLGVLMAEFLAIGITAAISWFGHTRFSFRRPSPADVVMASSDRGD